MNRQEAKRIMIYQGYAKSTNNLKSSNRTTIRLQTTVSGVFLSATGNAATFCPPNPIYHTTEVECGCLKKGIRNIGNICMPTLMT